MRVIRNLRSVNEGDNVTLKYPRHGNGNILCRHTGEVVLRGSGPQGRFICVKREDGSVRRFRETRMVDLTKF